MMYGDESYGARAYGEASESAVESTAFAQFLADIQAERCWILEVDGFSLATSGAVSAAYADAGYGTLGYGDGDAGVTGGIQTQRYSSHGYTSQAADAPANTWFDGRLTGDIRVDRRIAGRSGIGGLARVSGAVALNNEDGALDTLTRDYALDGRAVRLKLGRPSAALSTFGDVFWGVIDSATVGMGQLRLELSDGIAKLEIPVSATLYAGTGGLEGGADLKGKPKPRCWGAVYNIAPPLVDNASLIYQVNDGAISGVPAVYDRGIALALVGGVPAGGQYSANVALGTFTLGATPAGTVTADVLGDASGAGYVNKTGDIVLRLLNIASLTSSEIEPSSFSNLNSDAPAEVGIWIGAEPRTIAEAVDELLAGIGAFGGFNRKGAFSVGLVAAPSGVPKAVFSAEDILDLEREPLPAAVEPVAWRTLVAWQKNYTVQDDLAAGVTAARRTFTAAAERTVQQEDGSIRSRRLLAREYGPTGNLYAQSADAATEAARLFALWSAPRALYKVKTTLAALQRDLGHVVTVSHSRHGLAAGRDARVLVTSLTTRGVELRVLV